MMHGFYPHTHFTPYLDSAIAMGGPHVLVIDDPTIQDPTECGWEVRFEEPIPPERILFVQRYTLDLLFLNRPALIAQRRARMKAGGEVMCEDCEGAGEHRDDHNRFRHLREPGGASFRTREDAVNVCETCHGCGHLPTKETSNGQETG